MQLSSWLGEFRQRVRVARRKCRRTQAQITVEMLETKTLLTVTGVLIGTELSVFVDGNDSVAVRRGTTGNVEVLGNGAVVNTIPNISATALTSLLVDASDSDNVIDTSSMTAAQFPALSGITLDGGNGTDRITGSNGFAESILGGDGDDILIGNDGNDTINGGHGNDSITAGNGADVVQGSDGKDTIDAGTGNDSINGGDGDDIVTAGDGDDTVDASHGADNIDGGIGNDSMIGGFGNDTVNGGAGNDTIFGGADADSILGGAGNDQLTGNAGNDTIAGEAGDDIAQAGDGTDSVLGGDGNDTVNGEAGNDYVDGGAGNDLGFGGAGNDSMNAGDGDDTFRGNSGDDTLVSGAGADSLDGGAGNDVIDSRVASLSIDNVQIREGNSGTSQLVFTVSLSVPLSTTVRVDYASSSDGTLTGGNATAGTDYVAVNSATSGALVFAPGQTTRQISVPILGDVTPEGDETFFITLSNAIGASIFDGSGEGRLLNDDSAPSGGLTGTVYPGGGTVTASGPHTLTTGTGDASVTLGVDGFGSFGTAVGFNTTDATYDPIGPMTSAGTIFASALALRVGAAGPRTYLSSGNYPGNGLPRPAITGTSTDSTSQFSASGLNFNLDQSVDPLNDNNGVRAGSILTQTYTITNPGNSAINFELVRYVDGDLRFDGSLIDGGGRLVTSANDELLFETDAGGTGATSTTFVGISGIGGTSPATNRYQIEDYFTLESLVAGGNALTDSIRNDGNADGFIDARREYDVGLGLRNTFTLAAGASVTYSTHTLWGSGIPSAVGTTPPAPPPPAPPPPVSVGNDNDTLIGGDGNDSIFGGGADDSLDGGNGDDSLDGGVGNDTVLGGSGNDSITGGNGDDTVNGQVGNDTLDGGSGNDVYVWDAVNAGQDTLADTLGFQTLQINGTTGVDNFVVGKTSNKVKVSRGTASITANTTISNVTINGDAGNDTFTVQALTGVLPLYLAINGGDGNDTVTAAGVSLGNVRFSANGDNDNDTLTGSLSGESLNGGDGNDSITGNAGNDTISAGDGSDSVSSGDGNDVVSGDGGADSLLGGTGNDTISGGDGDDYGDGQDGNDSVVGGEGNDTSTGSAGNDTCRGDNGEDLVLGGADNDVLDGGVGNDRIRGHAGDDQIKGGDGNDTITGDAGIDTIDGGDGDDSIDGGFGVDSLPGGAGGIIAGGDGNDTILGGADDDTIIAGDGNDLVIAAAGQDVIFGGDGDDTLNGNGGTDTFNGGQGTNTLDAVAPEKDSQNLTISASVLQALAILSGL